MQKPSGKGFSTHLHEAIAAPWPGWVKRLWAGRVPESGEYRVEVLRRGAYCAAAVNHQLKVSLE